jgi:hypothetical protein
MDASSSRLRCRRSRNSCQSLRTEIWATFTNVVGVLIEVPVTLVVVKVVNSSRAWYQRKE